MRSDRAILLLPLLLLFAGCSSLIPRKLPKEPPPLVDMEEPLLFFDEPDDEAERKELPTGSFSGVVAGSARTSLDQAEEPPGVLVRWTVENSPAAVAGLTNDDLILAVAYPDGTERDIVWPSEWRDVELNTPPGTTLTVIYDRAGLEQETELTLIPRVNPPARKESERFRETEKVGIVVRTATEVEARSAGLGPGGGAVVVGMSVGSPWREAGIRFQDLIVAADGAPIDHPQVLLDAVREGEDEIDLEIVRDGERRTVEAPLSRREQEITHVGVPPLFDYESDRDAVELSILLGLVHHETTSAAWEWRILWLFHFSGGDADRLEEVDE